MNKSGFLVFGRVARSIQAHYLEIINFFEKRSTNYISESFNIQIKNFRSQFRGVKDKAFFLFRLAKTYVKPTKSSAFYVNPLMDNPKSGIGRVFKLVKSGSSRITMHISFSTG